VLKLFFCSVLILPLIYVEAFLGSDTEPMMTNVPTYHEFVEAKLDDFEDCQDTSLTMYFHETYLTHHSAEYLGKSIYSSEPCNYDSATIVTRIPIDATAETRLKLAEQANELVSFVKAHDATYNVRQKFVEIEIDTSYLNGGTSLVSFSRSQDDTRS